MRSRGLIVQWGRAAVARVTHNHKVAGSNPAPTICQGMTLERGASVALVASAPRVATFLCDGSNAGFTWNSCQMNRRYRGQRTLHPQLAIGCGARLDASSDR